MVSDDPLCEAILQEHLSALLGSDAATTNEGAHGTEQS